MQINVLEYFEKGALVSQRQKTAIVDLNRSYSFDDIERFSKNCAAMLLERMNVINHPIAVFLPKSAQTIVANLGILYTGNCYANLDLKSPPERLKAILQNLGAVLVITSAEHVAALIGLGIQNEHIFLIDNVFRDDKVFDNAALLARMDRVIDTDPLCIIHTSGSTGIPKGVALNHRSTIDFIDWVFHRFGFDGSQVIGSLSPFYFDIYTLELYFCLSKGATLAIIPEQCAAFPVKLLDFINAQAISFIFWVPTIMVNIANQDLLSKLKLPSLKTVFFAGEVFPTKHLNYWRSHLLGAIFVNLYGPIEISVDCTYFVVDREMSDDEKLPIGFPCRNTDILILTDYNQIARMDEPGEMCIRGSSLALGYWNDPERTAKVFVQNPLNTRYPELIYRTGDLVYRNKRGEIMFMGRKDYQIKHLGYRIELGEIEHAVLQIESIRNCCVVYHHVNKEIILNFEAEQDLPPSIIREKLGRFLPKYMLPTIFHRMELLPRNPNGKIDRQKLANLLKKEYPQ